ncbi:TPA: hypothetical protein OTP64_004030, partial [Escherichia coli]|nr:hypothetical protein [Escherichia coli]
MPHTIKKMSLIGLILMIFTSVFGFANSPSAYYLMGYSAIPFYIFSALLFFIPFALMGNDSNLLIVFYVQIM